MSSVAVKNQETSSSGALDRLRLGVLGGVLYVLGSLAVLFELLPWLWWGPLGFTRPAAGGGGSVGALALLVLVGVAVAGALGYAGARLLGPHPTPGVKAGVFTALLTLLFVALLTRWASLYFEGWAYDGKIGESLGIILTVAVGVVLLVLVGRFFFLAPSFGARMVAFEEQGWFSARRYKPSQGLRVRRATMLGIMLLGAAGIYSLYNHGTLTNAGVKDWVLRVPFSSVVIPILPDVRFTVPLLLAAATFWLAFRIVSLPVFADFLIATEAELNKVSWPARRSVIQDTVVVLVTVLLLTVFLFAVDLAWGWILSRPVVGVLQVTPQQQAQQRQQEQQRLKDQVEW